MAKANKSENRLKASTETNKSAKKKKKRWMKEKLKKKKFPSEKRTEVKSQQVQPPANPQLFSANWKTLQQILNASQAVKTQPVTQKPQNGVLKKVEPKEKASKNVTTNSTCPAQADFGKTKKQTAASKNVISKDSKISVKDPNFSEEPKSTAPKRKKDRRKVSNSEQNVKKKKLAPEEAKTTEEDIWFDDVDPDDIEATVGAEAADVMRKKQGIVKKSSQDVERDLVKDKAFEGLTRTVAMDCEMVGVGPGGEESILARVSIVNQFGKCVYDKYVKPTEKVTDYRTAVSGIRPEDIEHGEDVKMVQQEVAEILQGRILVGHAIHNDLKILVLSHPKKKIRDTQKYKPFKKTVKNNRPSLKLLCKEILNVKVQQGEHSSVQDAQATMRLYTLVKKQWEAEIKGQPRNKEANKKSE
ncbi:RNA exonuclease 4 [Thalassophryne amazonica]|uniref:RNA exonuclease 4 n=1 Tax=Thalassophryne amazonica TaxID=390379 RepID=UPI001470EACB|nr:RNA exonuclease 4 [Thalassophryne amazonica]